MASALAFVEPEADQQTTQLVVADGLIGHSAEESLQDLGESGHTTNLALKRRLVLSNALGWMPRLLDREVIGVNPLDLEAFRGGDADVVINHVVRQLNAVDEYDRRLDGGCVRLGFGRE